MTRVIRWGNGCFERSGLSNRRWTSRDFYLNVVDVRLGDNVADSDLVQLAGFSKTKSLTIHSYQVTDVGMLHLAGLVELESLWLITPKVTDFGLGHLSRMDNLSYLRLEGACITDDGLTKLERLHNRHTGVD